MDPFGALMAVFIALLAGFLLYYIDSKGIQATRRKRRVVKKQDHSNGLYFLLGENLIPESLTFLTADDIVWLTDRGWSIPKGLPQVITTRPVVRATRFYPTLIDPAWIDTRVFNIDRFGKEYEKFTREMDKIKQELNDLERMEPWEAIF